MKIGSAFPSKYLKADDLNGTRALVTIDTVKVERIAGGEDEKPVVYFERRDKGLVLNRTNATTISEIAGTEETASVDGIVHVGDLIVYDDNTSGAIFAHSAAGTVEIGNVGPGAADMGVMGDVILVPMLASGELVALRIE